MRWREGKGCRQGEWGAHGVVVERRVWRRFWMMIVVKVECGGGKGVVEGRGVIT